MPGTHKDDWAYLIYLVRHKFYVFAAGVILRVPIWRLIVHDFSKLRRDEWVPYRRHFYTKKRTQMSNAQIAESDDEFNAAWKKHLERNDHHWQHWVRDIGTPYEFRVPMSDAAVREMVADWIGANRVSQGRYDFINWWKANAGSIKLHAETRMRVVKLLEFYQSYLAGMEIDR